MRNRSFIEENEASKFEDSVPNLLRLNSYEEEESFLIECYLNEKKCDIESVFTFMEIIRYVILCEPVSLDLFKDINLFFGLTSVIFTFLSYSSKMYLLDLVISLMITNQNVDWKGIMITYSSFFVELLDLDEINPILNQFLGKVAESEGNK